MTLAALGLVTTIGLSRLSWMRAEFAVGLGVAFVVWALLLVSRWQRFGAWLALGVVGQAASLQLIEAGKACWYQHYLRPPARMLLWPSSLFLAIVVLQSALVVWGLSRCRGDALRWLRRNFTVWQLAAATAVFALTSATVSAYLPHYAVELLIATGIQAINVGTMVLCARSLPDGAVESLHEGLRSRILSNGTGRCERVTRIHPWVWLMAVVAVVLPALMNWQVYESHPHVNDEAICIYQARYLAEGRLYLSPPPAPAAFELDHMYLMNGKWFGVYSPGWPVILAPATQLGLAGLVNPLLNGLNVLLAYVLVNRLYGRPVAVASVTLLAVSPWSLFMAMSYMSHTITLSLTLGVGIALSRLHTRYSALNAALVGVLVGAIVLMRPLDGWVVMLAAGLYLLVLAPRHGVRLLAWVIVGGLPFLAIQLGYNQLLTGEPTRFPLMAYYDEHHGPGVNSLGFGSGKGRHWPSLDAFPGHSPIESLINANMNAFAINTEMFGWATGSLWPLILLFAWRNLRRTDLLLTVVILINVAVFALYWSSGGPDFGARYWSLSLVPLVVLSVRGGSELGTRLGRAARSDGAGVLYVVAATGCLTFMSLAVYLPWRCWDKYHGYLGMRPVVERLARERAFGASLVLVYGGYFDYLSAAVFNPVDLDAPQPVYAWARDAEIQRQVLRAYPQRSVWIVRGPGSKVPASRVPLPVSRVPLPAERGGARGGAHTWTAEGPFAPSERAQLPEPPDIDTALP